MEPDVENSFSSAADGESYAVNIVPSSSALAIVKTKHVIKGFDFSSLEEEITSEILEVTPNITIAPKSPRIHSSEGGAEEAQASEKEIESNRLKKENEEWKKKFEEEVVEMERLTNEVIKLKGNMNTEANPQRKNADVGGDFKTKQIAEKMKQLEKEKKKLQEQAESLELELAAKDGEYKSLQEKLTEERKARLDQEQRPSLKKPPLPARMPLRRLTNINSPVNGSSRKPMQQRRTSLALERNHGPQLKPAVTLPRRRATISHRPESGASSLRTPQPRPSLIPKRAFRKSNLYTSIPELLPPAVGERNKFMSSGQGKHSVGVALQRKSLLWSPLVAKTGSFN